MTDTYLFVGDHAETLASGRRVAPGDELPAIALSDDPLDQHLLDDGLLVKQTVAETPKQRAAREKAEKAAADQAAQAAKNQTQPEEAK